MRLDEINARLAAIQQEAETASGDALTALENEADALNAERQQILNEMQARQRLAIQHRRRHRDRTHDRSAERC